MTDSVMTQWEPLEEKVPGEVFKAEVQAWAKRIGVEPNRVTIRPMTTKWGSCSTKGNLTFNEELLHQPAPFRRRVIVEELLHLRVPNHGKMFHSFLRAYLAEGDAITRR